MHFKLLAHEAHLYDENLIGFGKLQSWPVNYIIKVQILGFYYKDIQQHIQLGKKNIHFGFFSILNNLPFRFFFVVFLVLKTKLECFGAHPIFKLCLLSFQSLENHPIHFEVSWAREIQWSGKNGKLIVFACWDECIFRERNETQQPAKSRSNCHLPPIILPFFVEKQ